MNLVAAEVDQQPPAALALRGGIRNRQVTTSKKTTTIGVGLSKNSMMNSGHVQFPSIRTHAMYSFCSMDEVNFYQG